MARIVNKDLLKSYHDMQCLLCHRPSEPHHVKSKGSGGDDVRENLMPLCRSHHVEIHSSGLVKMVKTYKEPLHKWLKNNNWEWDEFSEKYIRLTNKGWE